jgi:hypothetical protein
VGEEMNRDEIIKIIADEVEQVMSGRFGRDTAEEVANTILTRADVAWQIEQAVADTPDIS